ncbi:hypothetical protein D3C86_1513830 [compost metagenome]
MSLIPLLWLACQMRQLRMLVQLAQAMAITDQRTGIEHGLRWLLVHAGAERFQKGTKLRRTQADHQAGVSAKLTAAQGHRPRQLRGDLFAPHRQGFGQQEHRVDARHFGKHRNRLRPGRGHVTQGIAALERTGEAHGLNRRVLDQPFTDATAVDHVEHAGRHLGTLGGAEDRVCYPLGRRHVSAMSLEHHRATGRQRRGGITPCRGKRQWKITRTEHGDRAYRDAVLTQIRTR